MRRLILQNDPIVNDRIVIKDKEDIAYLSIVLRMKEGDRLLVSDGAGKAWETAIETITRDEIVLEIIIEQHLREDCKTRVTLYQGLPKGTKMEEVIRKATELGVYRIIPFGTTRAIPDAGDVSIAKSERWHRIAKEASRQSRRFWVPEIDRVRSFKETVSGLAESGYDLILLLYELEEVRTIKHALQELKACKSEDDSEWNIAVLIGPEGGFELWEVESLINEGAVTATMGDTILRTETAGPIAVAMILYELDL